MGEVLDNDEALIGIVVVNYGSPTIVERNLGSVSWAAEPVRVVLVDNYSGPQERAAARALADSRGWTFVPVEKNVGFGAGVNLGVRTAARLGCVTYLLLNPDAMVLPDVVDALRRHSLQAPLALISPLISSSSGRVVFGRSQVDMSTGRIRSLKAVSPDDTAVRADARSERWQLWLSAACLVVSAEMFDRVGGFDETFFLYWEDVEFSRRCVANGATLVLRSDLSAVHDEGGTQGVRTGTAKSDVYYFYNCRNRLLFGAKQVSRRRLLRWVVMTPAMSWEILLRGGRRQLVRDPRPVWAAVRGSWSGLRLTGKALSGRRHQDSGQVAGDVEVGGLAKAPGILIAHPGAELYGSDRVVLESIDARVQQGWRVTFTVPARGPLVNAARDRGAKVVICRAPVLRKSVMRPRGLVSFVKDVVLGLIPALRLIRAAGVKVVYVNTVTIPSWLILGRLCRRTVICHVHEAERAAPAMVLRLMAAPVRLADELIVNSQFSLDTLAASAPSVRARARVVYNGVPGPVDRTTARPVLKDGVNLLFVGRISPRKGPQVAVAALAELRHRQVDARLALLGSVFPGYEWFDEELRASVKELGLSEQVRFLGFRSDIWPDVAAADVVLVPSVIEEPFGNTAVEAVLAARPVIASSTSGLLEATAGFACAQTVNPAEPTLWADAVERVVQEWSVFRERAQGDAQAAAVRYSPGRYQAELARLVVEVSARRS